MRLPHRPVVAVLTCVVAMASTAGAQPWLGPSYDLDDFPGAIGNDGPRCFATAVVNSFSFLLDRYPARYGPTQLILKDQNGDRNPTTTRNILNTGYFVNNVFRPGAGGCPIPGLPAPAPGVAGQWNAKLQWFDDFAPGTTVFSGMITGPLDDFRNAQFLTNAEPSLDFLFQEILDGEDVEIGIYAQGTAHALTLVGIQFQDKDGDFVRDPDEPWRVRYLDPNNINQVLEAELQTGPNGELLSPLKFRWDNLGGNAPKDVEILWAFSESPVPEPGTFLLLGSGGGVLAVVAAHRKRRGPPT